MEKAWEEYAKKHGYNFDSASYFRECFFAGWSGAQQGGTDGPDTRDATAEH